MYPQWNQSRFFSQIEMILRRRTCSFFREINSIFVKTCLSAIWIRSVQCPFLIYSLWQVPFLENLFLFPKNIFVKHSKAFFFVPPLLPNIFSFPKKMYLFYFSKKKTFHWSFRLFWGCMSIDFKFDLRKRRDRCRARKGWTEYKTPSVARARRFARHVTSLHASHVQATEVRRATPTRTASADFRITGWRLA